MIYVPNGEENVEKNERRRSQYTMITYMGYKENGNVSKHGRSYNSEFT